VQEYNRRTRKVIPPLAPAPRYAVARHKRRNSCLGSRAKPTVGSEMKSCRLRAPGHGRRRYPRPAKFSLARRSHAPLPDAPRLPSSSSRRFRRDRESSGTRGPLARPVRLPGTRPRAHTPDTNRKYCYRNQLSPTRGTKKVQGIELTPDPRMAA
jgi:hypothetical protein